METITIDDKEHKIEDFNEQQIYCLNQIQDLNSKESNLKFQLDQVISARQVFSNTLVKSLNSEEEKE
jgi:hypothetical protein